MRSTRGAVRHVDSVRVCIRRPLMGCPYGTSSSKAPISQVTPEAGAHRVGPSYGTALGRLRQQPGSQP